MIKHVLVLIYFSAISIAAGYNYRQTGEFTSELGAAACVLFVSAVLYEVLDNYFKERGM